jgi:Na+-driven multidrug efflux pump
MLLYVVTIIGFIFTVIGLIVMEPVAKLLGAEGNLVEICVTYGRTLIIALIPFMLQNCFQSFLIVAEKPRMGLIISIITGVLNMILDFLFIYVFKMGVFGAAERSIREIVNVR